MLPQLYKSSFALAAALLISLSTGCSNTAQRASLRGSAPALLSEDGPAHRGGTNPNAPYLVPSTPPQLVKRAALEDGVKLDSCDGSKLDVVEVSAASNGAYRVVKLAFQNQGDSACTLTGYPAITLENSDGEPVASMVVDRVSATALNAQLTQGTVPAAFTEPQGSLTLAPQGEAWFMLGWKSGEDCPVVSGISMTAPGAQQSLALRRPLTVCEGRVQITTLHGD